MKWLWQHYKLLYQNGKNVLFNKKKIYKQMLVQPQNEMQFRNKKGFE